MGRGGALSLKPPEKLQFNVVFNLQQKNKRAENKFYPADIADIFMFALQFQQHYCHTNFASLPIIWSLYSGLMLRDTEVLLPMNLPRVNLLKILALAP